MRLLVCGSRTYGSAKLHGSFQAARHRSRLHYELNSIHRKTPITLLIEGEAAGADTMAREWAEFNGVEVAKFPADWETHGKAAGPIRNKQMLVEGSPDEVVAFCDKPLSMSRGTQNMIKQALKAGVPYVVHEVVKR